MRYGIPLFGERVAPRCTIADALLLIQMSGRRVRSRDVVSMESRTLDTFLNVLTRTHVDTLVCGGISKPTKELVLANCIDVVDNVAATAEQVIGAIQTGSLKSGFGLAYHIAPLDASGASASPEESPGRETSGVNPMHMREGNHIRESDCLACEDRICLRGLPCVYSPHHHNSAVSESDRRMIDSAMDIVCEEDRTLCRLSELIYFCLEMNYRRVGVAFCIDLLEPTEILVGVLRRFFEVSPVCCKIGGIRIADPMQQSQMSREEFASGPIACNPRGQAAALNRLDTDVNVIVGLCMGVDCMFAGASAAPVTTLFVKDRSLANNPIGALYSEYYLKEAASAPARVIR
jgi:uncharacterized metal-binding protein/predicted Fe-Mo cluster-binding NifX family protein